MQPIDLQGQTIYSDLLASCTKPWFEGRGLSFTKKKVRNTEYWYLNLKLGKTLTQRYLGPCNEETEKLINKEKSYWKKANIEKQQRARLVDMYLAAGGLGITLNEAKIINLLERAGVFLSGGVLVGTPAFRALGNNLGAIWEDNYRTKDLDLAADHRFPVVLKDKNINIADILLSEEIGAIEIPALNPKSPSTQYKLRNEDYIVDILAPQIGPPSNKPVFIKQFNTYATPLRYLEYLLEDIEPAVLPSGAGLLVNVPNPARFALHKLVISQRRVSSQAIKAQKDIQQASQVLDILLQSRPGSVIAAHEAAIAMGPKFIKQLDIAIKLLPQNIKANWKEWIT